MNPLFALAFILVVAATTSFPLTCSVSRQRYQLQSGNAGNQCSVGSGQSSLKMTNFFDAMKTFFDDLSGDNDDDSKQSSMGPSWNDEEGENDYPDSRVATIPVESMKPGGLRLFLMFYLMGLSNIPDKNSWRANQPMTSKDEYVIDFMFHDRTGLLTLTLDDDEITIDRTGATPSNAYMMQETVIVQGVLDELQAMATDENVAEKDRLILLLKPEECIDKVRGELSFS